MNAMQVAAVVAFVASAVVTACVVARGRRRGRDVALREGDVVLCRSGGGGEGERWRVVIALGRGVEVTISDAGLFTITDRGALAAACVDLASACHVLESMGAPHGTVMRLVYAYDAFANPRG